VTAPPPPPILPADRPPAPAFAEAAGQVMARQIRSAVRGKRLLAAVLLAAVAPLLAALLRDPDPVTLEAIVGLLVLPFLVPLVAVSLGSGLLYDEAEEGTLTFLFSAPVPRSAVVLGKWSAALAAGWAVAFAALGATFLLTSVDTGAIRPFVKACWLAVLLGVPAYLGVFVLLGTIFRRGFFAGLIYAFGFELVLSFVPGAAKRLSLGFFLHSLVEPHAPDREPFEPFFLGLPPDPEGVCIGVLLGVALITMAAALLVAPHKEFQARNVQG